MWDVEVGDGVIWICRFILNIYYMLYQPIVEPNIFSVQPSILLGYHNIMKLSSTASLCAPTTDHRPPTIRILVRSSFHIPEHNWYNTLDTSQLIAFDPRSSDQTR